MDRVHSGWIDNVTYRHGASGVTRHLQPGHRHGGHGGHMAQVGGGSGDYPHTASGVTTAGFIQERQTSVQNPLPETSIVHLYNFEKVPSSSRCIGQLGRMDVIVATPAICCLVCNLLVE